MDKDKKTQESSEKNNTVSGGLGGVVGFVVVIALVAGLAVLLTRDGGTDEAVAVVDGETITSAEYENRIEQFEQSFALGGATLTPEIEAQIRDQAIEDLINEALITNAAEEAGISVSDEEVEQRLQEIKASLETEEAYQAELDRYGLSEEDVRENIRTELQVFQYIRSVAPEDDLVVTDAEVQQLYNLYLEGLPEGTEGEVTLEEFNEEGKLQLEAQKLNIAISNLISELREQAEIEILIDTPQADSIPQEIPGGVAPPAEVPAGDESTEIDEIDESETQEDSEAEAATESTEETVR